MTADSDGVGSGPAADAEYESPVRFDRLDGAPRSTGPLAVPVPVRDPEATWFRATLRGTDAYAFFRPTIGEADPGNESGCPELRIPYIEGGRERGQFKQLMDAMVLELGIRRVRFTNLPPYGTMAAVSERLSGTERRDIRDAVDGFELVEEDWTDVDYDSSFDTEELPGSELVDDGDGDGDGAEMADCLVGEWHVDEPADAVGGR